jgi:hypothetical protein
LSRDEKTAFYLRHRDEIEVWAALRDGAREALITELSALSAPLSAAAEERGLEFYTETGSYTKLGLRKHEWRAAGLDLAVVLGWTTNNLLKYGADNPWPYVGVLVRRSQTRYSSLFDDVKLRCTEAARTLGWTKSEPGFPHWTDLPVSTERPDLASYAQDCLTGVLTGWTALDGVLDQSVRALP